MIDAARGRRRRRPRSTRSTGTGCCARTAPARAGCATGASSLERWLAAVDPLLAPRLDGRYAGPAAARHRQRLRDRPLQRRHRRGRRSRATTWSAAFRRGGAPTVLPLVRLGDVRPLHAMTVHRAQGSQFDDGDRAAAVADSPLATRQTFYTAITRASSLVRLVGSAEAVLACVERPIARATGLRDRLAGGWAATPTRSVAQPLSSPAGPTTRAADPPIQRAALCDPSGWIVSMTLRSRTAFPLCASRRPATNG